MPKQRKIISNTINIILFFIALEGFFMLLYFGRLFDQWPWRLVGFLIFGIFMVLLFLSSAIYHAIPEKSALKKKIQKIDHTMIYLMIAGSYTPICLLVLGRGWGYEILAVAWLIALIGIVLTFIKNRLPSWSNVAIYLFMGWLLLMTYPYLLKSIGVFGFIWLLASGVFYTIGTAILIFRPYIKRPLLCSIYDLFHLFIILGTLSYLILLIEYI